MTITVSTDGSALGNPNGPMGWAWADHESAAGGRPGHEHAGDCDAGGATNGTNQIGELCAVLEALRAHPGSEDLVIETDSQYAINCSTKWVQGWKRNGWKNSQKKPVKNADLIRAIDDEIGRRTGSVRFVWVKGHAGNAGNEKVDELARTYAGDCRSHVREGYLPLEGWKSLLASEYSRGTDVPEDARMLMDGTISAAEYHMGRGQGDSSSDSGVRGTAGTATASATGGAKPRSIADMLAQPEGVPDDLADFGRSPDDAMEADGVAETTALDKASEANSAVSTAEPSAEDMSAKESQEPHQSYAQMLVKHDYFPREDGEADKTAKDATDKSVESEEAENVEEPDRSDASAPQSDQPAAEEKQPRNLPKLPHRKSPSGLSVSGTVRFSPPPNSSPTFDGKPRLIRGYIAVEGYVDGDGTLILDEAPFAVKHS
ncbi:ribonuclease H family protein [Bifidobacterium sp.]|uniref:ribonuclease H family protein n=1 Tax=Bifidobacterium sp. TaxID=41200 RepID=UPI003D7CA60E